MRARGAQERAYAAPRYNIRNARAAAKGRGVIAMARIIKRHAHVIRQRELRRQVAGEGAGGGGGKALAGARRSQKRLPPPSPHAQPRHCTPSARLFLEVFSFSFLNHPSHHTHNQPYTAAPDTNKTPKHNLAACSLNQTWLPEPARINQPPRHGLPRSRWGRGNETYKIPNLRRVIKCG